MKAFKLFEYFLSSCISKDEDNIDFPPTFIGLTESKQIHVINNSDEVSFFEWVCMEPIRSEKKVDQIQGVERYLEVYPKVWFLKFHRLFNQIVNFVVQQNGELQPNTITEVNFIFKPEDTEEDEFEVLKDVFFTFALKLTAESDYQPVVNVRGKIVGPSFQLDYKHVDIGHIYLGESRFIDVNISNTGVIKGKIYFQKSPSSFDGIIKVSSRSEIINPRETKPFRIKYLGRKPGKFFEQAFFKVKNGERLSLVIQGVIKPLEILIEPSMVTFPQVAVCVPQMKFVMLRNNLPFDVEVKIAIENVGEEAPLEFIEFFRTMKDDIEEISPVPSSSSNEKLFGELSTASCSSLLSRSSIKHFLEKTGRMDHLRESVVPMEDSISSIYNRVDEYLEGSEVVETIVHKIFDGRVKDEIEKLNIAATIVDLLIENMKVSSIMSFESFDRKSWQIPETPCEIVANRTSFVLPAKSEKSFDLKVFLSANFIGKFSKNIKLRLLMTDLSLCPKQRVDETFIDIPVIYDCLSPEIVIQNRTNCISGYAESEIALQVLVENTAPVDGFFSFKNFEDIEMEVKCEAGGKFHIARHSKKIVNFVITPLKSGLIVKYVNLVVLGSNRKIPISIECKSLPPDIVIKPNKIFEHDLEVLKNHDSRIFIENRGNAKARFFVKLEHENGAFDVNPRGGILSSKQCVMITLSKFFYDPGDYKDILVVQIVNSKVIVSERSVL